MTLNDFMTDDDLRDYRACRLCPRRCGVDRTAGRVGVCGESAVLRIAHASPHFGEEPPISGTRGSGTLFFCGCACGCFFCQNVQISRQQAGTARTPAEFEQLCRDLLGQGVHNLNFVTPDHYWPHLRAVCRRLRAAGHTVPFVFNSSGYELAERVPDYAEVMDLFLPDFKFAEPELAAVCLNAPDYPETALAAVHAMVAAVGFLAPWDETGAETARRGVLVRHLVLPGQVENSRAVLRLLHREFGSELPLAVMSQYRPMPACAGRPPFDRPVRAAEYASVCDLAEDLGFRRVFLQQLDDDEAFLPDFTRPGEPFTGNLRAPPNS